MRSHGVRVSCALLLVGAVYGNIDRLVHQPSCGYISKFSRHSVVSQFNIVRSDLIDNETTPLQVGNGNFAFNVDTTGMQVHLFGYRYYHLINLQGRHTCRSTRYPAGPGITTRSLRMGMNFKAVPLNTNQCIQGVTVRLQGRHARDIWA